MKAGALGFGEVVELVLAEQLIQTSIKRVTRSRGQVRGRDPHRVLPIAFAPAQCHGRIVVRCGCRAVIDRSPGNADYKYSVRLAGSWSVFAALPARRKEMVFVRLLKHLFGRNRSPSSGLSRAAKLQIPEQSIGPNDFGPFVALFSGDRPAAYLSFLGMGSAEVQSALTSLSDVLRSTHDADRYIEVMLQGRGWRPHLVASVAVLLSDDRADYASALWRTFDYGSWVAPQLAVVLYFSDPEFRHEAKQRIVSRCPVAVATDPDAHFERTVRSKNIASLLRVVSFLPSETNWVASELERADVRALIKGDSDSSGDIVDSWLEAVRIQFTKFGRDLSPRLN